MIFATIDGRLGRDPELKNIGGTDVCDFSVASDHYHKGENVTTWVNVSVWGKRGESLARVLTKGSHVVVHGPLNNRMYEKKDGTQGVSVECKAAEVRLGPKPQAGPDSNVPF